MSTLDYSETYFIFSVQFRGDFFLPLQLSNSFEKMMRKENKAETTKESLLKHVVQNGLGRATKLSSRLSTMFDPRP